MRRAASLWTSFCREGLSWIYPSKCALCGLIAEGSPCDVCASQMELATPQFISESTESPLAFRACVFAYQGRAAQSVRKLKYSRSTSLSHFMAAQVAIRVRQVAEENCLIVPVPLHRSRLAVRGFNQAELCSAQLSGFDSSALRRIRATRPQAGLTLRERERNLEGAFWSSPSVAGRPIVLTDDVVTSGHTARECARALREAGAVSVGIVAFCGNLV
jgi:ComF family protein